MTDARLLDLIAHIKHAALDAQSFMAGTSRERFETDKNPNKQSYTVCLSLMLAPV